MKLTINLNSSPNLATRSDFARTLRNIADTLEHVPLAEANSVIYDDRKVRVGHVALTGAPAPALPAMGNC